MPYKPDDYTVVDHRVSSKEGTNTFQRMMFLIVIFEHKNLVLYILTKQRFPYLHGNLFSENICGLV